MYPEKEPCAEMEEQTGRFSVLTTLGSHIPHYLFIPFWGNFYGKSKNKRLISATAVLNHPSFLIEALKKPYVREENDNGKACVCLSNSLAKDCIFSYTSPMPLSSKATSRPHYSFKNTFVSII